MGVIYYMDKMYASGNGCNSYGGTDAPTSAIGADGDYYYQWDSSGKVQITYVRLNGEWHEIAGGDVIVGDLTTADDGRFAVVGEKDISKEGTIND